MSLLLSTAVPAAGVGRQLLPAVVSLTTCSRGYKKDMNKSKCVFGDQETKIPIYYNFENAVRETDPDAVRRFYRLHWGGWIRPKCGRRTKLWTRTGEEHWWMRQHLFCSDDQALAMEKMITPEYKKERHFVDDIYAPYHKRHGFECLPRGKTELKVNYFDLHHEY